MPTRSRRTPMNFAEMPQGSVPQGRNGKHKAIVTKILSDLDQVGVGKAIRVPLAELGRNEGAREIRREPRQPQDRPCGRDGQRRELPVSLERAGDCWRPDPATESSPTTMTARPRSGCCAAEVVGPCDVGRHSSGAPSPSSVSTRRRTAASCARHDAASRRADASSHGVSLPRAEASTLSIRANASS